MKLSVHFFFAIIAAVLTLGIATANEDAAPALRGNRALVDGETDLTRPLCEPLPWYRRDHWWCKHYYNYCYEGTDEQKKECLDVYPWCCVTW